MKKHRKFLAVMLSIVMILSLVPAVQFASAVDAQPLTGGLQDGVTAYTISTVTELKTLAELVNAGNSFSGYTFTLDVAADIEGNKVLDISGSDWTPIGVGETTVGEGTEEEQTVSNVFAGTFDGNGVTIKGLQIGVEDTETAVPDAGLFGTVSGKIKNLAIDGATLNIVSALPATGAIAAVLTSAGTISGCAVTNTTITDDFVLTAAIGGLVGSSAGKIETSYSTAEITVGGALEATVGGIVGQSAGTVSDVYFAGNVSIGESIFGQIGGIVGANLVNTVGTGDSAVTYSGIIENSYSVGMVSGAFPGGVAGTADSGTTIENCYYYANSAPIGVYQQTAEDDPATEDVDETAYDSVVGSEYTNTNTDAIQYFDDESTLTVSAFAAQLNATVFTGIEDAFQDITGTNEYPFPTFRGTANSFVMKAPKQNTTDFSGGNGSIYDPYQITTLAHLDNVRNYLNSAFVVKNAITVDESDFVSLAEKIQAIDNALDDDEKQEIANIVAGYEEPSTEGTEGTGSTEGTVTKPDPITSIANVDLSILSDEQIAKIELITGELDLTNGALADGPFAPIGLTVTENETETATEIVIDTDVFTGYFDGNGKTITGLDIVSDYGYGALFVYNYGTITNLKMVDCSVKSTMAEDEWHIAAGVATENSGKIIDAVVDIDVTAETNHFVAYVGGIVGYNYGVISGSENKGIILATFTDDAYAAYADAPEEIVLDADIYVGGAVAYNDTQGIVTNCKSNASARSEFVDPTSVMVSPYIAVDDGDDSVSNATASAEAEVDGEYLIYTLPTSYSAMEEEIVANGSNLPMVAGSLYGGKLSTSVNPTTHEKTATPCVTGDNHQLITIEYTSDSNTYKATFVTEVTTLQPDIIIADDSDYVEETEDGKEYITNIQPSTTVATLKTNLENDATTIQVVDKDRNAFTRDNLATGDKVQLIIDEEVVDEKTIVVLGDANGDATVNILDLLDIVNHMSNNSLEGPYKKAANTSGTSETIDILDVLQVINYM